MVDSNITFLSCICTQINSYLFPCTRCWSRSHWLKRNGEVRYSITTCREQYFITVGIILISIYPEAYTSTQINLRSDKPVVCMKRRTVPTPRGSNIRTTMSIANIPTSRTTNIPSISSSFSYFTICVNSPIRQFSRLEVVVHQCVAIIRCFCWSKRTTRCPIGSQ